MPCPMPCRTASDFKIVVNIRVMPRHTPVTIPRGPPVMVSLQDLGVPPGTDPDHVGEALSMAGSHLLISSLQDSPHTVADMPATTTIGPFIGSYSTMLCQDPSLRDKGNRPTRVGPNQKTGPAQQFECISQAVMITPDVALQAQLRAIHTVSSMMVL